MATSGELQPPAAQSPRFATTQWTLVLAAAEAGSPAGHQALAQLCERYWYPLYAFIRRSGQTTHAAEDLTQEFLARLLDKGWLKAVQPERGKFRSFLLAALQHFLANEYDRARAQKRGGGRAPVAIDGAAADSRYTLDPADELTPEKLYERRWALAVLNHVLERLAQEQADAGKSATFAILKPLLTAERHDLTYADVARQLDQSEGAIKVLVHRLRRRYRDILRDEIGQTVENPADIDDEIRYLRNCL